MVEDNFVLCDVSGCGSGSGGRYGLRVRVWSHFNEAWHLGSSCCEKAFTHLAELMLFPLLLPGVSDQAQGQLRQPCCNGDGRVRRHRQTRPPAFDKLGAGPFEEPRSRRAVRQNKFAEKLFIDEALQGIVTQPPQRTQRHAPARRTEWAALTCTALRKAKKADEPSRICLQQPGFLFRDLIKLLS